MLNLSKTMVITTLNIQYLFLIIAWLIFGLLHSLLANNRVKQVIMRFMGRYYSYYRLLYSIFSAAMLILVVYDHYSVPVSVLWLPGLAERVGAQAIILVSVSIMVICIIKYFPGLSGIRVVKGIQKPDILQSSGLHAFVRHPLYSGTLLFVLALFFLYPYMNNLISCICISLYTLIGIFFEERKLIQQYGDSYLAYQLRVPMLVPRFFD